MELALYCPNYGYYETEEDNIGRQGDFYTNVSVGPVFGELLAWQFSEWLSAAELDRTRLPNSGSNGPAQRRPMWLVESGAHNGMLAKDILNWLRKERPALYEKLTYIIIEPSPRRRAWQERSLTGFEDKLNWLSGLECINQNTGSKAWGGGAGIIFSNEFLDAFPVNRYGWDSKKGSWFEWGVEVVEEKFVWIRLEEAEQGTQGIPGAFNGLLEHLPDGFTIEVSSGAARWWGRAAELLHSGKLITFDYGWMEEEMLLPERKQGTLRSYCNHKPGLDPLTNPGQQDLTAHINFHALQQAGENAGLETEFLDTQERFLAGIFRQACATDPSFRNWTSEHRRQFQTLIHPEHLGTRFRTLLQSRR